MPTGRYLTCVGHCAASWKNFTSFHSTPSIETEKRAYGEAQPHHGQPGLLGLRPPAPWGLCLPLPRNMVFWCLAVQMRRVIPSMTWLLGSRSFSFGFLLRNITEGQGQI